MKCANGIIWKRKDIWGFVGRNGVSVESATPTAGIEDVVEGHRAVKGG